LDFQGDISTLGAAKTPSNHGVRFVASDFQPISRMLIFANPNIASRESGKLEKMGTY
jgi:hypothetical protein